MSITLAQSADADADNPTATFGATPGVGSLLVVIATLRSGDAASTLSISGTGWTKELEVDNALTDGSFRCSMAVWWKVAGASEPTGITITTPSTNAARVVVSEWAPDAGETFVLQAEAQNTTGSAPITTMPTGTTASTTGDQFIVTCIGARSGDPSDTGASWSNATSEIESGFGVTNARVIHMGGLTSTATGTKADASSCNSGTSRYFGACAGILVFTTSGGGTTYEKAGALVTAGQFVGADTSEHSELGILMAGTVLAGISAGNELDWHGKGIV